MAHLLLETGTKEEGVGRDWIMHFSFMNPQNSPKLQNSYHILGVSAMKHILLFSSTLTEF
jgi:hypothetical protein